jgi:cytochrome c oxidase subunit II
MRGLRIPAPVVAALPLLLAGCGGQQSILSPGGPGARAVESLWWFALGSTGVLALLVILGLLHAVRRARRAPEAREGGGVARSEERFILLAGGAFPTLFLVVFLAVSVRTGSVVSAPPEEPVLNLEVVGHQYWWEVRYPDLGITTANEIHIPAGGPVEVRVTAADVIHSFWVPQISAGKVDMIPGRTNRIWLQADEPGVHRGQCTEFCGVQHALMSLLVVVSSPEDFEGWVAARREPRASPQDSLSMLGHTVFVREGCGACHALEGVSRPQAVGSPGPDLTDLGQRRTLGALTLTNDPQHLADWIRNPHRFKPGVRMPAFPLEEGEMEALVTYLGQLP